jgi:hypothetical protein
MVPRQFHLPGRKLDQATPGDRQSGMASRRTLSARRFHRGAHDRPAERVVAFYNKRGTCEQWIKEGKGAKWTWRGWQDLQFWACPQSGKSPTFTPVRDSSGESQIKSAQPREQGIFDDMTVLVTGGASYIRQPRGA